MNRINFTAKESFPLSSDTMERMQQMIGLNASIALLGGANYILSGCENDGSGNVSDGIIVIAGEIMPFSGGAVEENVVIIEEAMSLNVFGISYPEAYVFRKAVFSNTGVYLWADFRRVMTNRQIEDRFNALKEEPTGFIKMWSGRIDRIPQDYLLCNGDVLPTAQYPDLAFSLGRETEQTFELPDLRRRFIAGYDNAVNSGYNVMWDTGGEESIELTLEQIPSHLHQIKFVNQNWGDNANSRPFPDPAGTSGFTANTEPAGGGQMHENRPPYFVLAYVIKVK